MISDIKKFIFIHIHKVAGTSINHALDHYKYQPGEFRFKINEFSNKYLKRNIMLDKTIHHHATALEHRNLLGSEYNSYFKFCFVRNPFDWQVSMYHYARMEPTHPEHEACQKISFEEYIQELPKLKRRTQKDFNCDFYGKSIVNYIGRFERLNADFDQINAVLNLGAQLPHLNQTKHKHYSSYYNDSTAEIVVDVFKEDFRAFGYSEDIADVDFSEMKIENA